MDLLEIRKFMGLSHSFKKMSMAGINEQGRDKYGVSLKK